MIFGLVVKKSLTLRAGSSRQGKAFRANVDASWVYLGGRLQQGVCESEVSDNSLSREFS